VFIDTGKLEGNYYLLLNKNFKVGYLVKIENDNENYISKVDGDINGTEEVFIKGIGSIFNLTIL